MKLSKLLPYLYPKLGLGEPIEVRPTFIDDIFRELNLMGVEAVEVDRQQMNVICHFLMANKADNSYLNGGRKRDFYLEGVLRENKADRFMGVDVTLEK